VILIHIDSSLDAFISYHQRDSYNFKSHFHFPLFREIEGVNQDSSSDAFISYPQKDSCNFKPHFPSPCQGGLRG